MMKIFPGSLMFLFLVSLSAYSSEPNMVRVTEIGVSGGCVPNDNRVSKTYTDGLGRTLQTKVTITNSLDLTTCTFYDELGRPHITTRPLRDVTNPGAYHPGDFTHIKSILDQQYASYKGTATEPYAYSETRYFDEPFSTVKESSLPGPVHRIGSGNTSRSWTLSVGKENVTIVIPGLAGSGQNGTVHFDKGFIISVNDGTVRVPDETVLDKIYTYFSSADLSGSFANRNYALTIQKDAEEKYLQTLDNQNGLTELSFSRLSYTNPEDPNTYFISGVNYDIIGNVIEETPPSNTIAPTKYMYNTLQQLIRKETPDGAIDSFEYDKSGLLIKMYRKLSNGTVLRTIQYSYDHFQRLEATYVDGYCVLNNLYDDTKMLSDERSRYGFGIPENVLPTLTNTKGRLVAAISYNSENPGESCILDLYSYDNDGNVDKKYKFLPDLPMQKIVYTYDNHGKVLTDRMECGNDIVCKQYIYDKLGRLVKIIQTNNGNKVLSEYIYDDANFGQLVTKKVDDSYAESFEYTILDQLKVKQPAGNMPGGFKEAIAYKADGNIDNATMTYSGITGVATDPINYVYTYDNLNRLVNVKKTVINSIVPDYCAYTYDKLSRFITKKENTSSLNDYMYYGTTSRLSRTQTGVNNVYVYDAFGNMVIDKTKKMVIQYDWRDLPIKFKFYSDIPTEIGVDTRGTYTITGSTDDLYTYMSKRVAENKGLKLLSTVHMMYDAAGNRVLKMETFE